MDDPSARFDASNPHGSVAHDMAQCFQPDELDQVYLSARSLLVEEIKLILLLWINKHPGAILQDILYRINTLPWHSTIESGLYQFVEEKTKEAVLAVV